MTYGEFYNEICGFEHQFQNRDLEEYLLALLKLVRENKEGSFSAVFALELLKKSFTEKPADFREDWLKIEESPDENVLAKKFTNPCISEVIDKSVNFNKKEYEFTTYVLLFQIAELHKMRGKQLEDENKYFGITSETGAYWYNFDPLTNLECGARGMCDNYNEDCLVPENWQFLGELLEMGRVYE